MVAACIIVSGEVGAQASFLVSTDSTVIPEVLLGEVQVNASKDNLRLNEMPASVSLLPENNLEENEINSLPEISGMVPNFFMPDYGSKLTSPVYIRGIGSRINEPSVGLYVDNVPYFQKAAFDIDFFDISRIEVLRGPQGTLYGRNTMGGIINITTLSPFDHQGTHIKLSAGTYGLYSINAGHYGKIREKFGYSVAANFLHNDGFFTNTYTMDRVDRMDSFGFRTRLAWKLSDKISLENIASFEKSNQGGYPYALYNDSTGRPNDINYNQYSSYNRSLFSNAFIVKYVMKHFEIVATTAYQYLADVQEIDQDFMPDSLYFVAQRQKQHMMSQEVIMRSKYDGKYNWLMGAYGFLQKFDKEVDVDVYAAGMKLMKKYDHTVSGYALFHQSTLSDLLIRNLSVTAGIRIDFENDVLNYGYDQQRLETFTTIADTIYPSLNYFEISPKVAVTYNENGRNYYATITRGFKTGGFNSTIERPEDLTYGPEYSWNYEVGIKSPLFNYHAYLHASLFYIDWKNQQIYQTVPSGRGSMLKNAGRSASRGIELMLKTKPFFGIEPLLTYGYTHATFTMHVVDSLTDYSGNYIPYVPRHTASIGLRKTIMLNEKRWLDEIRINLSYRGAGKIFWNEENSHAQDYYGLLSAKLSFVHEFLTVELWGKNILDTSYEAFYFEALGNKYVQSGKPLQVGLNLSVNF